MKVLLVAINALLFLLIVGLAFFWQPEPDRTPLPGTHAARMVADVQLATAPTGGDFTLDGAQGAVSLHDFKGKVVVLYFGYTYCPDICPTSLSILAQALGSLSPTELARVQPIFVSVDPQRDTVARLAEYAVFFHPSILGLTGTPQRLKEIADRYGVAYAMHGDTSGGSYTVDHSALTYLIDPDGKLVASLPHGTPAGQLLTEIRQYLPTH
jgi:protein SCO1